MSTYILKFTQFTHERFVQYRVPILDIASQDAREFFNATATFASWGGAFVLPFLITFA